MAETIVVSVGLVVLLAFLGVALYVVVSKMRAAQDRRDYAAVDRGDAGTSGVRTDEAARGEPSEEGDHAR